MVLLHNLQHPVASGVKKSLGQQTDANFQQTRLWVHKIAILPLYSLKMGTFSPKFC